MKKRWIKELLSALALLLALTVFCAVTGALLIPPRRDYGATWDAYLAEERNSLQALFFGSSLSYCNIVPAAVWAENGVACYGMAGPEQTPGMTYYYVREALKTQSPQAIFVEVTGVFFPRYTDYTKVNIGYMPWGYNRLAATVRTAEPSERMGLFFPLYNYHDRWNELPRADLSRLWTHTADDLAGYTFLSDVASLTGVKKRPVDFDRQIYDDNIMWLRILADYCTERGVLPVFYISPSCYRLDRQYLTMLRSDLPDGAVFRDFNEDFDRLGLDTATDFYDYMHFNWRGAEQFSADLAQWMTELGVTAQPCDGTLWQSRVAAFDARKEAQP